MLYAILKPIMKAALRLYFGRIVTDGLAHIDNSKPTLILANHTASFMDALIVACFIKRRIHFFARGDVFGHAWADKLLRSLGLLPVYRVSEGRDKLGLNDSSNEEALKILAKGGAVLIFAEGVSNIAKVFKPLKKGPFRLAAVAAKELPLAPVIVPLGINYIMPTRPGGDVFLVGAPPMATGDFVTDKSETGLAQGATAMMRQTAAALVPLVWHVERPEDDRFADLLLLALQEWRGRFSFRHTQLALKYVNARIMPEARRATLLAQRWSAISFKQIRSGRFLLLLLGVPLAAIGWAFHKPVMWLANFITKRNVSEPDFYAPVFLSCAIVLTVIWYVLWLSLLEAIYTSLQWLPFFLLIAGCGVLYRRAFWPVLRKGALVKEAIGILRPYS